MGVHAQCRFCGDFPFTGVPCPEGAAPPAAATCAFEVEPATPYYWEAGCSMGMHGCNADGVHPECRFCEERPFETVPCPEHTAPPQNECHWPQRGAPNLPHFWDETCEMGVLGCWADGIHAACRFCGSGVYSEVACPDGIGGNATASITNLRGNSPHR